uniref:Uncharacterized protein n=1 Tax=Arundo donax TaxID=35708 RepID=A0A0A9ETH0_ARUDO
MVRKRKFSSMMNYYFVKSIGLLDLCVMLQLNRNYVRM